MYTQYKKDVALAYSLTFASIIPYMLLVVDLSSKLQHPDEMHTGATGFNADWILPILRFKSRFIEFARGTSFIRAQILLTSWKLCSGSMMNQFLNNDKSFEYVQNCWDEYITSLQICI